MPQSNTKLSPLLLSKVPKSASKILNFKNTDGLAALQIEGKDEVSSSRNTLLSPTSERTRFKTPKADKRSRLRRLGIFPAVPQGSLGVYAGPERKRYVISTSCLSHSLFKELLERSAEEFGFEYEGGLSIACDCELFEKVLKIIKDEDHADRTTSLDELISILASAFPKSGSAKASTSKPVLCHPDKV